LETKKVSNFVQLLSFVIDLLFNQIKYHAATSWQKRYVAWSIMHTDKRPTYKEGKVFTVNYRVHSLDDTLAHLRSLNVPIKGQEDHDEGRFAWIDDPEGNTIELWQE